MTLRGGRPFLEFPLLRKELVGLLRTRRAFWLLLIAAALTGLLPLLAWPRSRQDIIGSMSETVLVTLYVFFLTQLTAALLVIPAFTAGAISGERERDTYDLLYSTLLSPLSIALAKAAAPTGYVLLFLAASAPAACVLYLLGGVSFGGILRCYGVTFAAVVMSGLVCLSSSMRSRRTAHAVMRGIVWVVFWNGGLLLLLALGVALFISVTEVGITRELESIFFLATGLTPFYAIGIDLAGATLGIPPSLTILPSWAGPWLLSIVYSGIIGGCQILYLFRKVRTPEIPMSRRRERRLARKGKAARPVRRPAFARLLIGLGEAGIPLLRNPLFLKELRSEFFSRPWYRRGLFWGTLAILGGVAFLMRDEGRTEIIAATMTIAFVLAALIVPGLAASGVPREVEQGNLDFLRGTLLRMREILTAKLFAALYGASGIVAAGGWIFLGALLFGRWGPRETPAQLLAAPVGMAIGLTVLAALGTAASVWCRKTLGALLAAYLAAVTVYLLVPIFLAILFRGFDAEILCAINPFIAIPMCAERSASGDFHPGSALAAFAVVHGGIGVLLWLLAVVRANRLARD